MSGSLSRRLTVLEEIAARARRNEVRAMVAAMPELRGLTPALLEEATDEALRYLDEIEALRRQEFSEREIVQLDSEAGLDPAVYR